MTPYSDDEALLLAQMLEGNHEAEHRIVTALLLHLMREIRRPLGCTAEGRPSAHDLIRKTARIELLQSIV